MEIVRLWQRVTPQRCTYHVGECASFWRRKNMSKYKGDNILECGNIAKYKVGKKHYCRKHMALVVLDVIDGNTDANIMKQLIIKTPTKAKGE